MTDVHETVAKLNIERFTEMLTTETDEAKRVLLLKLLKQEEAKLTESAGKSTP